MKLAAVVIAFVSLILSASACREATTDFDEQLRQWKECISVSDMSEVTLEEAARVNEKYRDLIMRQPNWNGHGAGLFLPEMEEFLGERAVGITIFVSELVDQETLPEEDRIGDCLEGVPVRFIQAEPSQKASVLGGGSKYAVS